RPPRPSPTTPCPYARGEPPWLFCLAQVPLFDNTHRIGYSTRVSLKYMHVSFHEIKGKLMLKPSRVQYLQIKSQHPDAILFYQVGDFYETYDEDAHTAARVLQILLTRKTYGDERVPMAGVPLHSLDNYVGKLIQ